MDLESYADADGSSAHPGVRRLAEGLRTATGKLKHISERTVRSALAAGVERGFIELTAKAPRGRGNKRADVYRLTLPAEIVGEPDEIVEVQTAGIRPGDEIDLEPPIAATQTAGNAGINSGNSSGNSGNQSPKYQQPGLPTTSSFTPAPNAPVPSSRLCNARAGTGIDLSDPPGAISVVEPTDRIAVAKAIVEQYRTSPMCPSGKLPTATRAGIANATLELLKDGYTIRQLADGIAAWAKSGMVSPTQIANFVNRAANTPADNFAHLPPASAKAAGWLQSGERLAAYNRPGNIPQSEIDQRDFAAAARKELV